MKRTHSVTQEPWIGVDLDGTLAFVDHARPYDPSHIGRPIASMVARVKAWQDAGQRVKIFTARIGAGVDSVAIHAITKWCAANGLGFLEIVNAKDIHMIELWDDRAVQVHRNTGIRADGADGVWFPQPAERPTAPLDCVARHAAASMQDGKISFAQ